MTMSLHRFIRTTGFDGAELALRSDGTVWARAAQAAAGTLQLDRGAGWLAVDRVCLCHGDRLKAGAETLSSSQACARLGIELPAAPADDLSSDSGATRQPGPQPVRVSAASLERARRNPGTGQIEPMERKKDE